MQAFNYKEFVFNEQENLEESIKQILAIQDTSYGDLNEMIDFSGDTLNEGKINDLLKKSGLHIGKNKGLISYMRDIGAGVAKIIFAAIKGDKEAIKDVMKTVSKEAVLDFILKLDMATLHIITTPIHTIDAITGWHLWANVKKAAEGAKTIIVKIKDAINTVKLEVGKIIKDRNVLTKHTKNLQSLEAQLNTNT